MENTPTVNTAEQFSKCRVVKHKTENFSLYEVLRRPLPNNPYYLLRAQSWAISDQRCCVVRNNAQSAKYATESEKDSLFYPGGPITDTQPMFQRVYNDLELQLEAIRNNRTNKLLEKIGRVSVPLIAMYKERRETEKLLVGFVNKALFTVRNLRHPKRILWHLGVYDPQKHTGSFLRKLKKKTMSAETAGDAWLQYRFAWKPLIHDIQTSVIAAAEQEKKLHTFRVSTRKSFHLLSDVNYYSSTLYGEDIWHGEREGGISAGISYSFSDTTLAALSSVTSIPATLWDLAPWSFVIDRLVDISTLIELYDATNGVTFEGGYLTTFYRQSVKASSYAEYYWPNKIRRYTYEFGSTYHLTRSHVPPREDVYMNREVLHQFPEPRLEYPLSFYIEHGIDYAALLRQLSAKFRKKPR